MAETNESSPRWLMEPDESKITNFFPDMFVSDYDDDDDGPGHGLRGSDDDDDVLPKPSHRLRASTTASHSSLHPGRPRRLALV